MRVQKLFAGSGSSQRLTDFNVLLEPGMPWQRRLNQPALAKRQGILGVGQSRIAERYCCSEPMQACQGNLELAGSNRAQVWPSQDRAGQALSYRGKITG